MQEEKRLRELIEKDAVIRDRLEFEKLSLEEQRKYLVEKRDKLTKDKEDLEQEREQRRVVVKQKVDARRKMLLNKVERDKTKEYKEALA